MRGRQDETCWSAAADFPSFGPLDRDLTVDAVVIGGGATGLSTAYLLKRAGATVAVIERGRCAAADTGHTSAHLTYVTDLSLLRLCKSFGDDHAQAAWDAGRAAIDGIEDAIRREAIECAFARVPGYVYLAPSRNVSAADVDRQRQEAEKAQSLGFDATFVGRVPLVGQPGVRFADQARFHPLRYLAGLARAIHGDGSWIFEGSAATEVRDEPLTVFAGTGAISCGFVVATHNPIVGKASWIDATWLQTKLSLYTSYVVSGRVGADTVPDALFWDTADPYTYLRVEPRGREQVVVFGGEDHKTGQEPDPLSRVRRLEDRLRAYLPAMPISHRWSGQVIETNDGLPFIGEIAPRQFAATGFGGNGLTFGTLAGIMATDLVMGRANPWSGLFDIGRTKIKGGLWDYLKENKDYPYYMLRDRVRSAEARSLDEVPRGEGRIVSLDGHKVAAFRDDDGALIVRAAVCTHLGCLVRWNPAGRSWDCPCHGSRFAPNGDVLAGPAESPLEPVLAAHVK